MNVEKINSDIMGKWPVGMKKTKARLKVIALLNECSKPLSAIEIYEHLICTGEKVNQSTIYRILETFVEQAMIQRIHFSDESISYYEKMDEDNADLDTAVCLSCKKREYLEPTVFNQEEVKQQASGFQVKSHRMEVYGYCGDCSEDK